MDSTPHTRKDTLMDHKKRYRWRKFPREFMVEQMGSLETERVDWLLKKRWFVGRSNSEQNYVYASIGGGILEYHSRWLRRSFLGFASQGQYEQTIQVEEAAPGDYILMHG